MSTISKTVITITVLHPSDTNLQKMDLVEMAGELVGGHGASGTLAGKWHVSEAEEIDDEDIPDELCDLGYPEDYFDDLLEYWE